MSLSTAVSQSHRDIAITGVMPLPPEMNRHGPSSSIQVNLLSGPSAQSVSTGWNAVFMPPLQTTRKTRLLAIDDQHHGDIARANIARFRMWAA